MRYAKPQPPEDGGLERAPRAAHTPGPWKASYRGAGGWSISNTAWCEYLRDARITKADARLIAAAPDLLAALVAICDSGVALSDELTDQMLAAIAKARGES